MSSLLLLSSPPFSSSRSHSPFSPFRPISWQPRENSQIPSLENQLGSFASEKKLEIASSIHERRSRERTSEASGSEGGASAGEPRYAAPFAVRKSPSGERKLRQSCGERDKGHDEGLMTCYSHQMSLVKRAQFFPSRFHLVARQRSRTSLGTSVTSNRTPSSNSIKTLLRSRNSRT